MGTKESKLIPVKYEIPQEIPIESESPEIIQTIKVAGSHDYF